MARVNNVFGISGKVGDLFFYRRDGKSYVKRVGKRKAGAECSEEQWRHRMRFRTAVKFASRLPEEVKAVLDLTAEAEGMWCGQSFFVSQNLKVFLPDGTLGDPGALRFTEGSRAQACSLAVGVDEEDGRLTLYWSNEGWAGFAEREDRLVVFAIRERLSFQVEVVEVEATRRDGRAMLPLAKEEGSLTHLYCCWLSADGKSVSPTQHLAV